MRPFPSFLLLLAGVGATGLWSGCVVNQAKEVHQYREVLDQGLPKVEPLQPRETLTLGRALLLANADNEQLASQGETYLQALIAKSRAFSAFLPTINFQPNFTAEQAPKGIAAGGTATPVDPNPAAVAASQGGYVQDGNVFRRFEAPVVAQGTFSPRAIPLYQAAKIGVAQQRQLLIDTQQTILLNVAQAYFQVLISTQQVGVLQHSLVLQEARVSDLRARLRMQLAIGLDLNQALANEAATQVQLSQALNDMRNGRRMLALLIGVGDVDGPLVNDIVSTGPTESMQAFVDRAMAQRQDLQAAADATKEARLAVKAAIEEYYPSVSLNLAGYLYRENYADASKWAGLLLANLPIYSGGAIKADVRDAWSHLRQAALFESYLRRQVLENVRTAYDNLATSGLELADLDREVTAAAQAYRQARQLEKNGLAIPLDVLTAQDTLLNAQLQYANEAFSRTLFRLDLIRSAGDFNPLTPSRLNWTSPPPPDQFAGHEP
jgi:outer membrane protein TolC